MNQSTRTQILAAVAAISLLALGSQAHAGGSLADVVFADFSATSAKTNLTWSNTIVPAVYKTIPAVTQTIPAVTKVIPAVTKIVNGKTVIVTPAHTVIVTQAKTIIITPAQKVLVTPAHDGPSGSLFSTTASNANTYGLAQVNFAYLIQPLSQLGHLPSQFSFQAASPLVDPAVTIGSLLAEPGLSGTFSFTYDGAAPLKVWDTVYNPGAVLLAGTLKNFLLDGAKGGGSGAILAPGAGPSVVDFTSDLLDFSHTNQRELSFYFLSSGKFKADSGEALHTIAGNAGGSFSSAPRPRVTAVPEPAAWAMMLLGFAGIGASLRAARRRGAAAI